MSFEAKLREALDKQRDEISTLISRQYPIRSGHTTSAKQGADSRTEIIVKLAMALNRQTKGCFTFNDCGECSLCCCKHALDELKQALGMR